MSGFKGMMTDEELEASSAAFASRAYPDRPGYKTGGTSEEAARAIDRNLNDRQEAVMRVLRAAGARGLTPDEAADELGVDITATRPRFTELGPRHKNMIEKTGERRPNKSGLMANVYRERHP